MIISHARKFIFVKTIKTAGSSLELALARYCADGDVLTPLPPDEEALRAALGGVRPQNYFVSGGTKLVNRGLNPRVSIRELLASRITGRPVEFGPALRQHTPAAEIRRLVGDKVFAEYFKFAVMRNPYDRAVSYFYYEDRHTARDGIPVAYEHGNMDQWIRYHADTLNENWGKYTERDRPIVDFVARYENLAADLAVVSDRIGLDHNIFDEMKSIRAKDGYRPKGATPDVVLTDTHRQLISVLCREEIRLGNYSDPAAEPRTEETVQ